MMAKTSGDSTPGVSGIIFGLIQDSFTTQQRQNREAPPARFGWWTGSSPARDMARLKPCPQRAR
jgi:hypothetical protein